MDDQPQGVDAPDLLERMTGVLDAEDAAPELPDDEPAPVEEEAAEKDKPETPEAEEELEEITHNGEVKKLTKAELKDLAQQGFDYTQKTQQIAEQRRYLEAQEAAINYRANFQSQFTEQLGQVKAIENQLAEYKKVDWQALANSDPMQYLTAHQQYQEVKETYQAHIDHLNQMQSQAQQVEQQQTAQRLAQEAQAMKQAIPEWKDATKATAEMNDVKQFLGKNGFNDAEIRSVMDHRHVVVARKAMLYDKLMAAGQKKVHAAPPPSKPGSTAKPTQAVDQKLRDQLRRTGSSDAAAKLIERML